MPAAVGYHCSHEQLSPSALLDHVQQAQRAGFQAAMCSDHFHPWLPSQGQSGFSWSWLGAAMQATGLSFGTVCAPGQRYHPAIIAQAAATLAEMFPGRFWLAIGSGEALNERINGAAWPEKSQRNARLREAAEVIRALWAGETVSHQGCFTVRQARLYSRPVSPPQLFGAALTAETARWMGSWADGLITAGSSLDGLRKVVDAFRNGGGAGKPLALQTAVSLASSRSQALAAAHDQWRHAALAADQIANLATPEEFAAACRPVTPDSLADKLLLATRVQELWDWLEQAAGLGFDHIYLHQINRDAVPQFIEACGESLRRQPAFAS
ncbi:MAG: LLM class F420-dependent oxidoreductase [Planctomycetota bacterium]|nr:MAG: LLM class F420-dependent oxidoreductase [Planctomycetota bacterium]